MLSLLFTDLLSPSLCALSIELIVSPWAVRWTHLCLSPSDLERTRLETEEALLRAIMQDTIGAH